MVNKIWLIRHGLRIDFENADWKESAERPDDPPLSERGKIQAKETAQYLKNEDIDALFASPYLRTIQTAHYINEVKGLNIKIEPGLGEWLNPVWFKEYPHLLSFNQIKKQFKSVDSNYKPVSHPQYPENEENVEMYDRLKKTLNYIIRNFNGNIAIVGHGATLAQAGRVLLGPSQQLTCRTCGINCLVYNTNGWQLKFATSGHLSITEDQIRFH